MGFILSLLGYTAGAGITDLGGDMYGAFLNWFIWWSNWTCMYGC